MSRGPCGFECPNGNFTCEQLGCVREARKLNAAAEIEKLKDTIARQADEIERLRDTLRDVHDDLEASYPWAYTLDKTTIADFQKSGEKINDKVFKALYPDFKEAVA